MTSYKLNSWASFPCKVAMLPLVPEAFCEGAFRKVFAAAVSAAYGALEDLIPMLLWLSGFQFGVTVIAIAFLKA